jgi:hypothetical protein
MIYILGVFVLKETLLVSLDYFLAPNRKLKSGGSQLDVTQHASCVLEAGANNVLCSCVPVMAVGKGQTLSGYSCLLLQYLLFSSVFSQ